MIQLDFTVEEEQHLREDVKKRLADLEHEIAHTEALNFKDMLKRRREVIKKLLDKLPNLGTPAT
jgi:hypothetical protein